MDEKFKNNKTWVLTLFAFLISFFLSPLTYHPWSEVNPDGILYLHLANIIQHQSLTAAFKEYDWIFYPCLIAWGQKLTHLSMVNTAYLINAVCSGFAALFFVKIVRQLGAGLIGQCLAIVVVLSSDALLDYRDFIIRDHAYWSLYLASLFFLLNFAITRSKFSAIIWNILTLLMIAFRVEGVVLLATVPILALIVLPRKKINDFLKLNMITIAVVLMALAFATYHVSTMHIDLQKAFFSGRDIFVSHHAHVGQLSQLTQTIERFYQEILPSTAKHSMAIIMVLVGLIGFYLFKAATAIGLFNVSLYVVAQKKSWIKWTLPQYQMIIGLFCMNFFIAGYFLLTTLVFSTRYIEALIFTALLIVPLILEKLWYSYSSIETDRLRQYTGRAVVMLYVIIALSQIIYQQVRMYHVDHKNARVQANIWLKQQEATLGNICSNQTWPAFTVNQEYYLQENVLSKAAAIDHFNALACRWLVYSANSMNENSIKKMQHSNQWQLVKTFQGKDKKRSIYIFQRKN